MTSLTVIVTSDVENRYRGFLASAMLEISTGVYTSSRLTAEARDHVWGVLEEWFQACGRGSVVMTWTDHQSPSGQGLRFLGTPCRRIVDADGLALVRR